MHPRSRANAALLASLVSMATAAPAAAYNYVPSSNGESWGVHDAAAPRVDTGSIRDTTSNGLRGFGGIRVRVSSDDPRNGELVRGFGLRFDPPERFESTQSVDLGGVAIERTLRFHRTNNWGRWLDTFRNTTGAAIDVDVAFGGQTGLGSVSGATNSRITETSSGDDAVTSADSWALTRTGTTGTAAAQGPSAVVIGDPNPFAGALPRMANFLRSPFTTAPATTGHESNYVGYQHSFRLEPGATKTLVRFVVIGTAETSSTVGTQVTAVRTMAQSLADNPPLADLPKADLCALHNWDVTSVTVAAFDPATCSSARDPEMPPVAAEPAQTTGAKYEVFGKTIGDLQRDMASGVTTSAEITRGYLDRIAAYDVGPWGLNSYTTVAADALDQARKADRERTEGRRGALLGIPITVKDLLDTKDMPTTNGSLVFEGFRSREDATQVRLLREAGAIIIGKASLEEYAQSGHYSDSAYGQVWNAFSPSKSALGSSGGPATATAASLAAGSLGSQTGDSLYAPASGQSLYTLRATDGVTSLTGAMPLTWLQDHVNAITKSLPDLADIMNATAKTDPADPLSAWADPSTRFAQDWRTALDPGALQGKRIAYYDAAFTDPFGTSDTTDVQRAALRKFEDAGATLVRIGGGPTIPPFPGGDRNFTGWDQWIKAHPESPYEDAREIIASQKRLPYRRSANGYTGVGAMSDAQIAAYLDWRQNAAKDAVDAWLDSPPNPVDADTGAPSPGAVDAVAFPGLRSVISLNDSGGNAFGRGDPPTNGAGAPTVAFPAGVNGFGEPTNLQLAGRAFSDRDLLGYAYAFDRIAQAHLEPTTVPPLAYRADPTPPATQQPAPVAPAAVAIPAPAPPASAPVPPAPAAAAAPAGRVRPLAMTSATSSTRAGRWPLRLTTTGRLRYGAALRSADACVGRVAVLVKSGSRTVSTRRTGVRRRNGVCAFASQVTFRVPSRLTGTRLRVQVRFLGNQVLLPRSAASRSVRIR